MPIAPACNEDTRQSCAASARRLAAAAARSRLQGAWQLLLAVGLVSLGGANCVNNVWRPQPTGPPALPPAPTLDQVINVVNRNNSQIMSFTAMRATLSGPGFPSLQANVAYQQPRRFRLRAETGLTGPELDVGSNEELFWFWIRRDSPPTVYYCRHELYQQSAARQMIPIDPDWLIEALGIAPIDPALPHHGPFPAGGSLVEIRTVRETPEGPNTKVTLIDTATGFITAQRLYDGAGQLLASAETSRYRRDPLTNLAMPSVVKIDCPGAKFSMRIDLGTVKVNRLSEQQGTLWTLPHYEGSMQVDLCDPRVQPPGQMAPTAAAGPTARRRNRPLPQR